MTVVSRLTRYAAWLAPAALAFWAGLSMPLAEEENTPSASNSSRPRTAAPPVKTNAASNPATAAEARGRLLTILRRKQNLPAKQLEVAMHGALTMLAETPNPDIPAAAAWLRSQQSQPGWPADSLPVFFRSMAYHHPAQVMETVQAMGPDSATGRWPHAADAMSELTKTTAFNALYWLRKNPESPLYDEAALAWTKHVSASLEFTDVYLMKADGVAAIHANIKDPAMRTAAGEIYATARAAKDNKK